MKKHFFIAAVITSAFVLSGCSASTPTSPETETPSVEAPTTEAPGNEAPTTRTPEAGEELTPKMETDAGDIPQRSLKDLNALDATIKATMSKVNQTGLVQIEDFGDNGSQSTYVYDPTRTTGEQGIHLLRFDEENAFAIPMGEEEIAARSGNGGLFIIDSLFIDTEYILDILTYNEPAEGLVPSAEAYESMATQNGYELVSPIMRVPIKISLTDGLITKIIETQDDGTLFTYTFKFDVSEYAELFDDAYPED